MAQRVDKSGSISIDDLWRTHYTTKEQILDTFVVSYAVVKFISN